LKRKENIWDHVYNDEGDACELANVPMEQLGDGRFRVKMNIAR
jgi:hypothetical protein